MFRKTRLFLLLCLVFALLGGWLLVTYTKDQLLFAVNGHYFPLGDALMPYWTDWGLGEVHVALIVFLVLFGLFVKKDKSAAIRWGWLSLLGFAIASLMSQFLKTVFFNGEPRPLTYFRGTPERLHHVPGVPLWAYNSFPSGHTITAFSIALTLIYLFTPALPWNRVQRGSAWTWSVVLFLWACSVGYSRMYLGEHFFRDVYWGALIGILTTLFALWLGERTLRLKKVPV